MISGVWCRRSVGSDMMTSVKYRKKPVVIKAEQVDEVIYIDTLEGIMRADPGDWIITGVKGERYPVKNDIFLLTYEEVDE